MAVTFQDARTIVYNEARKTWAAKNGSLITLRRGYQDDTHWQVIAGAREYLVGGDDNYTVLDAAAWLVDKATGKITKLSVLEDADRLGNMTSV
jgi:hypothetical protein